MERCMEHFSHSHSLILREIHHFKDLTPLEKYDHCHGCGERLLCKSFVYTCSNIRNIDDRSIIFDFCANFFLHKKCAHLPPSITTHDHEYSNHQKHDLFLETRVCCKVCCIDIRYFYYYSPTTDFQVCLKCAIDLQGTSSKGPAETIQHWSHQHTLLCVDRYATFHCDGCNKVSTDCSYKCDKCSFWIHQSCAELPKLYTFIHHHKHPLTIASSLPEVYSNFFQYCKICKIRLNERQWVYYCADCRFFAHIPCVVSTTPKLRGGLDDDDPELMHLPAADEASMNFMMQKRIKDILSESVDTAMAPPDHINHWAHPDHQLERKNKSDVLAAAATCDHHHDNSQQLVSSEESLMICDGCTKPISFSSDDADVFYECNQCKYILHRYCAQFPKEIKTPDKKLVGRYERGEFGIDMFQCVNCFTSSNGFSFDIPQRYGFSLIDVPYSGLLDIWCACLPDKIKHRAHRHPLKQYLATRLPSYVRCAACCLPLRDPVKNTEVLYMCCDNFYLHVQCVLKEGTVLHRWDPHPLSLVHSLEDDDIENHPHEFECEFCCEEIDTNGWFYHCKVCDLSFHLYNCMDFNNNQYHYSNVKFGATNIRIEEAH